MLCTTKATLHVELLVTRLQYSKSVGPTTKACAFTSPQNCARHLSADCIPHTCVADCSFFDGLTTLIQVHTCLAYTFLHGSNIRCIGAQGPAQHSTCWCTHVHVCITTVRLAETTQIQSQQELLVCKTLGHRQDTRCKHCGTPLTHDNTGESALPCNG